MEAVDGLVGGWDTSMLTKSVENVLCTGRLLSSRWNVSRPVLRIALLSDQISKVGNIEQ